jgi:hypothetical protein
VFIIARLCSPSLRVSGWGEVGAMPPKQSRRPLRPKVPEDIVPHSANAVTVRVRMLDGDDVTIIFDVRSADPNGIVKPVNSGLSLDLHHTLIRNVERATSYS